MRKESIPNSQRAICNGKIATIHKGQRIVQAYQSGQQLVGSIPDNDAPPFTGYVRGWFRKGKKSHG
jgi:hypothetical protein